MKNEADVVRKEHVRTALKIATAPLTVALAAAVAAAVLLIVWSPAFVETRRGDICLGRVALWSAAVGIATFAAPSIGRALRSSVRSKSPKRTASAAVGPDDDDLDFEE